METIEFFLQQHSIEKSANTKGQYGFPIEIKVDENTVPMSKTEYNVLFEIMKQQNRILTSTQSFPNKHHHVHGHPEISEEDVTITNHELDPSATHEHTKVTTNSTRKQKQKRNTSKKKPKKPDARKRNEKN